LVSEIALLSTQGDAVRVRAIDLLPVTGGDFAVEIEPGFTVERGSEASIPVSFEAASGGFHTARIQFETSGEPSLLTVELRAYTGTPSLDLSPTLLDFGDVPAGSARTASLRVDNDGSAPITLTEAQFTGPFAAATALPFVAPAGVVSSLDLTFSPTSVEAAEGSVVFTTLTGDTPAVALRGNNCATGAPAAYDRDRDGVTTCGGDCDDTRSLAYPGAFELPNGIDDDCDGAVDEGTAQGDDDDDGSSETEGDCDDLEDSVYPGAAEVADGIDNDCDGQVDEGTPRADDDGDGSTEDGGDCNDADPAIGPHAREVSGNDIDEDCNSATL
jgi:hypothetical protein